jgi:predicted PurR-regulated permease PerM
MGLLPHWLQRATAYAAAALVLTVVLWVAVQALMAVRTVTFAIVGALLLAALMDPVAGLLRRLRLPAWLAALLSALVVVGVLAASVTLVVARALSQVTDLQQAVTDGIHSIEQTLLSSPIPLSRQRLDNAEAQLVAFVHRAAPSPSAGATMVVDLLTGLLLGVFLLFFFLRDGARMWGWVVRWTPAEHRERTDQAGRCAWEVLTRYARGTVVVALIDSVGIGAGMFALGVPLAASLTLIVFVGAFVPIVGALVSGVLAVGVTLVLLGPVKALVLLGIVIAVQQAEGNLLQPMIMGRVLRLHPVVIVTVVTVGTIVGGVLGAVVAVPLVAVSYRVVDQLAGPTRTPDPDAGTTTP